MKLLYLILILISFSINAGEKFSSVYTNLSKDCQSEKEENIPEGGDVPLSCKGPNGYTIIISYSACMEYLKIVSKNGKEEVELPSQPIGSADSRKVEWRILNKNVIGIIYRTSVLKDTPNENCSQKRSGKENLEIRGLGKYSNLISSTPSEKNGNEKAREILESFVKENLKK